MLRNVHFSNDGASAGDLDISKLVRFNTLGSMGSMNSNESGSFSMVNSLMSMSASREGPGSSALENMTQPYSLRPHNASANPAQRVEFHVSSASSNGNSNSHNNNNNHGNSNSNSNYNSKWNEHEHKEDSPLAPARILGALSQSRDAHEVLNTFSVDGDDGGLGGANMMPHSLAVSSEDWHDIKNPKQQARLAQTMNDGAMQFIFSGNADAVEMGLNLKYKSKKDNHNADGKVKERCMVCGNDRAGHICAYTGTLPASTGALMGGSKRKVFHLEEKSKEKEVGATGSSSTGTSNSSSSPSSSSSSSSSVRASSGSKDSKKRLQCVKRKLEIDPTILAPDLKSQVQRLLLMQFDTLKALYADSRQVDSDALSFGKGKGKGKGKSSDISGTARTPMSQNQNIALASTASKSGDSEGGCCPPSGRPQSQSGPQSGLSNGSNGINGEVDSINSSNSIHPTIIKTKSNDSASTASTSGATTSASVSRSRSRSDSEIRESRLSVSDADAAGSGDIEIREALGIQFRNLLETMESTQMAFQYDALVCAQEYAANTEKGGTVTSQSQNQNQSSGSNTSSNSNSKAKGGSKPSGGLAIEKPIRVRDMCEREQEHGGILYLLSPITQHLSPITHHLSALCLSDF